MLSSERDRTALSRTIRTRPRLFISVAAALATWMLVPRAFAELPSTRFLVAWNTGTCLFLVLAGHMFSKATHERMLHRARLEDEGAWTVLVLVIVASIASLVAIVVELAQVKGMPSSVKAGHVALAGLTVLSSWAFMHTMFAMHYANNWFLRAMSHDGDGGLAFPAPSNAQGNPEEKAPSPDYFDFLYFSFIVGTSAQTADVSYTSKGMRRLGTVHCVLSFIYNTSILALCINIAASLI